MAEQSQQQQDSWTQGVTNFREAVEHNVTASRLMATGAIALGAAATAYFWDSERRNAFLETSRRFSNDMTSWWSGLYSGGQGAGQSDAASSGKQ